MHRGGASGALALAADALYKAPACPPPGSVAGLAQLVEHLICNQGVGGSNPSAGTIPNHVDAVRSRSSRSQGGGYFAGLSFLTASSVFLT